VIVLQGSVENPLADVAGDVQHHSFVLDRGVTLCRRIGKPGLDPAPSPEDAHPGVGIEP
jgi:hypothetical protein